MAYESLGVYMEKKEITAALPESITKDRLEQLKEKGFKNLSGTEKDELLKEALTRLGLL